MPEAAALIVQLVAVPTFGLIPIAALGGAAPAAAERFARRTPKIAAAEHFGLIPAIDSYSHRAIAIEPALAVPFAPAPVDCALGGSAGLSAHFPMHFAGLVTWADAAPSADPVSPAPAISYFAGLDPIDVPFHPSANYRDDRCDPSRRGDCGGDGRGDCGY
jgi:hypothetical protein